MFSSFDYLLVSRITQKLLNRFSKKIGGKAARGPRKKTLDFGGNPDHVTLGLCVIVRRIMVRYGPSHIPQHWVHNFAASGGMRSTERHYSYNDFSFQRARGIIKNTSEKTTDGSRHVTACVLSNFQLSERIFMAPPPVRYRDARLRSLASKAQLVA